MIGERIVKLEKFFGLKKPRELNEIEWLDRLQEIIIEWEEENQKEFPIQTIEQYFYPQFKAIGQRSGGFYSGNKQLTYKKG